MSRAVALALLALGAGFVAGFVWGRETRAALPGATQADFARGVLTVRVDTFQALAEGAGGLLGSFRF